MQLLIVLLYYECLGAQKDFLEDTPDTEIRHATFTKYLKRKMQRAPKYPFRLINSFNKKKLKYSSLSTAQAIQRAQSMLATVERLAGSAGSAASAYDRYISFQIDLARGK